MPFNQRQITEEAKFTYSPSGKAFEKQTKTIEERGKKHINAITNQVERKAALNNKDNHKDNYKEIFEEIEELAEEINHSDLIYYFTGNTATKRSDDFSNGIEIQSGEIKLEEVKKPRNVFKSNLNEISKRRYKSEGQKCAFENIKLRYKSREAVIKLFNGSTRSSR